MNLTDHRESLSALYAILVAKNAHRVIGIERTIAIKRDFEVSIPFTNCKFVLNHTRV